MKKNFFKKLSFVLALAMIVTALAPAAGVFAKAAPKLNATSKYLYLDVADKNGFDFNVSNKQTGWKYLWSSANKNVAAVDKKNGVVTATGVGSTKVSVVITDKAGEEVDELTATVVVRDNIKDLVITNKPAEDKLAVGVEQNFNRSFTTVSGSTKKTSGVTRWSVDKTGATINATNGVFVATAAGTYTITARAFQSNAKYTSWLSDNTKYASYVTATATYTVTVATSMVKATQTTLKKFDVTFDSAMVKADVEKNLAVSYMAGTAKVKELVKGVTMSTDNKTATVELYVDMQKGATYVVDYTGMKAVQFVSATTKPEDVASIAITTTKAEIGKKTTLGIALYNKDKVDISGDPNLLARVIVEKKDSTTAVLDGKDLYMYKVGDTVNLTATYHTYVWTDGKEVGNLTATQLVTCVEQAKDNAGTLNAYTVATSTPANFKDVKHTIFKGTNGYSLFVELKGTDAAGNEKLTNNKPGNSAGTWKYTTSDSSTVMVDPNSGAIYGAKEGSAVVVVYLNDVNVAACQIEVTGAQKAAIATLDTNSIVVSNSVPETVTVGLKVKDQLGNDYAGHFSAVVKPNNETTDSKKLIGNVSSASATAGVALTASTVAVGTYYYTVTVTDSTDANVKISAQLSVTVQDPGTAAISYYKVEPDKTSYDLKDDTAVTLSFYGYTAAGVKKAKLNYSDVVGLDVRKADATSSVLYTGGTSTATINLTTNTTYSVSGGTINLNVKELLATGTYTIKATTVSGSTLVSPVVFEVKNTRDAVKVTTNKLVAADGATTVLAAINDCFDFTIGDGSYEALYLGTGASTADNYGVKYNLVGNQVYLDYIYIYEPISAGATTYYAHKVSMNGAVITLGK